MWAVAGVSAAGASITGATNSVIAQTGHNFSGMNNVNWGQVGQNAFISGTAGFAGSVAGSWAANASFLVNGVNSPLLRSAIVSPIAAGAGHIAGGTTANLLAGQNLSDAFANSFDGIGQSLALGTALGMTSTIATSYASGINPLTGERLNWQNQNKSTSYHAEQRMAERNISQGDIYDALKNPLKVTDVQFDSMGRPSVKGLSVIN